MAQERRLQSNGNTVNFNIKRSEPSVTTEVNGVQTQVYGDAEQLAKTYPNAEITDPKKFASKIRSKSIPAGAEPALLKTTTKAKVSTPSGEKDWRVKLSVPDIFQFSDVLRPLSRTGGFVFPFTPTIILQHSANYNALQPVHSNYPFYNYQNSQVDQIVIGGDFFVENEEDAKYWVAATHYLKSVTKMFYGADSLGAAGNPPPIVRLNGYGDYVFNNVPVVILNFMVDMPQDVDYIKANVFSGDATQTYADDFATEPVSSESSGAVTWVPTQCTITVTVQPIYSRSSVEQFSLSKFVNGDYINTGKGYL